jgi:hypothetical protein
MSLLRLLTTGKTLVGLKKLEQRYHLPGGKALPQFGGKQNPFRATAFPEKIENSSPEDNWEASKAKAADACNAQPKLEQEAPAANITAASRPAESTRATMLHERESEKRSPFRALLLWGRAKKTRPANGLGSRPLIQAELSLDGVKVVRNDLSESDFEIVPAGQVQREATTAERRQEQPLAARSEIDCVPELSKP